ncbi:MAG: sialate O-acetylesterase [Saprospiraceae bacterium]
MFPKLVLSLSICLFFLTNCQIKPKGKHLFILSGQSNMARLDPANTFTPAIAAALGSENILVVKIAQGGQAIKRWYRDWQLPDRNPAPIQNPKSDLYDSLMTKVNQAILEEEIASVTFIWMQGERDAKQAWGDVYEESLLGLYRQVCEDLNRNDINFVIGRLSDFDLQNNRYPHWTRIREIQVKVAESAPNFAWVNTDDLNDGLNQRGEEIKNDLHLSEEGYALLGERFAKAAIELIQTSNKN